MKTRQLILPILTVVMLMSTGCGRKESVQQVRLTGQEIFRDGDLVLRCGHGLESRAVTYSSRSVYSHIGILQYDSAAGKWMVIHAVPGENKAGEKEYIKREPIDEFYCATRATVGAYCRVRCSDSIAKRAAQYAECKRRDSVVFDNDYLLKDTTEMYCTELVWQAYRHEGIDLSDGHRDEVPRGFCREGECIFPSTIQSSEQLLYVKPI